MEAVDQQSARTAPLVFTDVAAAKVGELIAEEGNSALMLRVFISGGGCSGFQYGFTFDERRDRLQRRSPGCPVYHPQSQCSCHLRMRIFVLGLE
jgi:Fe-S cluster assembly iron-binding protein IscA